MQKRPWWNRVRLPGYGEGILLLIYAGMIAFITPHHAAWIDEAASWMLVREVSLRDLLFGEYTHNYGHTVLWYLVLMPFAKAGLSYDTIYIINGFISAAMVWVFLRYAPFSVLTKILWMFSALIAYQYAVVARPYSLTVLLLFAVAVVYPRRFDRPLTYAASIFMLFEAHVLVFMVPCVLTAAYAWEMAYQSNKRKKRQLAAVLLMVAGGLVAVLQLAPPDSANHQMGGIFSNATIGNFFYGISHGWLPYALMDSFNFPLLAAFVFLLPFAIFSAIIMVHGRKNIPMAVWLMSMLWCAYIFIFKFQGSYWHHGLMVQIILFCLWITSFHQKIPERPSSTEKLLWGLIQVCLAYSCVLTPFLYYQEHHYPYSSSRDTAEFLRRSDLTDRTVVLDRMESIAPYLPEETCLWAPYAPYCHTHMTWDGSYYNYMDVFHYVKEESSPPLTVAAKAFGNLNGKIIILPKPVTAWEQEKYRLALIYCSIGFIEDNNEAVWVYVTEDTLKEVAPQLNPVPQER